MPDPATNDDGDDLASRLDQLHPLTNVVVTNNLDAELLKADSFFILSSLLNVATLAWCQVISFLDDDISHCKAGGEENLNFALKELRFNARLLEHIEGFPPDNLLMIRQGCSASWPQPSATATMVLAHMRNLQAALDCDVQYLVARCSRLAKSCELSTEFLVSSRQLMDSQASSMEAQQVHRLTQLASLFVPISLLASLFSMNVAEFSTPPSIWVFFFVAILLFRITCTYLCHHKLLRQIQCLKEAKERNRC